MSCERCEALQKEHDALIHDHARLMERETETLNNCISRELDMKGVRDALGLDDAYDYPSIVAEVRRLVKHDADLSDMLAAKLEIREYAECKKKLGDALVVLHDRTMERDSAENRWKLAMDLLKEIGADNQFYFDRIANLIAPLGQIDDSDLEWARSIADRPRSPGESK